MTDDFYYIEIKYNSNRKYPIGKKIKGKQDIVYQKDEEKEDA